MTTDTVQHEEPTVGKVLPDLDFEVTEALLDDYAEGLALERLAPGGIVPSMVAGAADNFHGWSAFSQDRGHLWMRQVWDLRAPLIPGASYVAHGRITDIYKRRDRTVVLTEMTLKDADGQVVVVSDHHQSFLLDEPVDQVQFRDPNKKEGARKFIVPDGTPIEPLDTTITLEMCGQYFHGSKSYHTDLEASQALGFQQVVVGGRMTMSYMGHLVERHFGPSWWTSGRLDVKFTNPVWPNDHLTMKGVATGAMEDDPARDGAFAWIEKDDGTIVLIATASIAR
jgi:acyl dehydratase